MRAGATKCKPSGTWNCAYSAEMWRSGQRMLQFPFACHCCQGFACRCAFSGLMVCLVPHRKSFRKGRTQTLLPAPELPPSPLTHPPCPNLSACTLSLEQRSVATGSFTPPRTPQIAQIAFLAQEKFRPASIISGSRPNRRKNLQMFRFQISMFARKRPPFSRWYPSFRNCSSSEPLLYEFSYVQQH